VGSTAAGTLAGRLIRTAAGAWCAGAAGSAVWPPDATAPRAFPGQKSCEAGRDVHSLGLHLCGQRCCSRPIACVALPASALCAGRSEWARVVARACRHWPPAEAVEPSHAARFPHQGAVGYARSQLPLLSARPRADSSRSDPTRSGCSMTCADGNPTVPTNTDSRMPVLTSEAGQVGRAIIPSVAPSRLPLADPVIETQATAWPRPVGTGLRLLERPEAAPGAGSYPSAARYFARG